MTQIKKRVVRRFNWRKFVLFCTCAILLVMLAVAAGLYAFLGGLRAPGGQAAGREHPEPTKHEPAHVLVLGLDVGDVDNPYSGAPGRSDTMIVATLDPDRGQAGLLSLPRDSRVAIPGYGVEKICHAHAYGGADLAVQTVESLLNIPIHYYVKINYEGLRGLVEALGGVYIDVKKDMKYTDRAGGLYIDIEAGPQLLDGTKAEEFLRFRSRDTGDLGRVERQQQFVRALGEQVFSASTLFKIPELSRIVLNNVETNMTPAQIVFYANAARNIDISAVPMEMLAGIDRYIDDISYWIVDQDSVPDQVARVLLGIDREANRAISLEILNGCGSHGAAGEIARQFEGMGYTINKVGNAADFNYDTSEVVYGCHTPLEAVEAVAKSLNIEQIRQSAEDEEREADITVIVGQDLVG
ncbi:MAG TPA: LCP family protein [bacterium]|jgi:LCP family protein required for cell wall assembly|nr:LCP family protein [bacterium]